MHAAPAQPAHFNPLGGRAPFDAITDLLIPACILGMIGSLVNFIIDVRSVHLGEVGVLRHVCLWFLIGVVCISRLLKKYGGAAVGGPYIAALAGATALFLAKWSAFSQSNLTLNLALFGGAWWAIHKLTDECTVEENVADEGETGLLAGLMRSPLSEVGATRRRHPGRLVMLFGLIAIGTIAALQSSLASDPAARQRAFFMMVSICFFSLALLALTSLSGLRIYARQRGARLPGGVPSAWIMTSALVVALMLGTTALIPRGNSSAINVAARWFQRGDPLRPLDMQNTREGFVEGFRQSQSPNRVSPRPGDTDFSRAKAREGKGAEAGQSSESQNQQQSGGSSRQPGATSAFSSYGSVGQAGAVSGGGPGGGGGSSSQQQQSQGGGGGASETKAEQGKGAQAGKNSGQATKLGTGTGSTWWWWLLLLLLAYLLYRWVKKNRGQIRAWILNWRENLRLIPGMIREALVNCGASCREAWERMLAWLRRRPQTKEPTPLAAAPKKRRAWSNPFTDISLLNSLSPRELVEHTYRGLLDLAELRGCPRGETQTPIEFLRLLPSPLRARQREAAFVTGLYVQAAYTPNVLAPAHVREMSKVWETLQADFSAALAARR